MGTRKIVLDCYHGGLDCCYGSLCLWLAASTHRYPPASADSSDRRFRDTANRCPLSPPGSTGNASRARKFTLLLNKHPVAEMIIGLTPGFEAKTGIKVIYEVLSEVEHFEKQRLEMASGTGLYDVTMTSPGLHFRPRRSWLGRAARSVPHRRVDRTSKPGRWTTFIPPSWTPTAGISIPVAVRVRAPSTVSL